MGAVGLLTILALWLRIKDLALVSVSLSIDESRLALVARGIQEHGWPVLPSGKVYTRGLPAALSIVPSLAFLGQTDFAARLPGVLFGTLTVPVVAVHAGRLGGLVAALVSALLIALYPPLISWSRQAWFFSLFVLLWMLTLVALDVALSARSRRPLIVAALATAIGLLTHELFLTLLPYWLLTIVWLQRQDRDFSRTARLIVVPLAIVAVGLALLVTFTLTHRADTVAGRMSEVTEYLTLNSDLAGFRFYGRMLADRYWLLLIAAVFALVWRRTPRRFLLLLAIIPLFIVDAFVLPDRPQERYGLALVPPMIVLAATGLHDLAVLLRQRFTNAPGIVLGGLLMLSVPLIHLDLAGAARRTDVSRISGTWLADLQRMGYRPGDTVMTDIPTVVYAYLGRTDYWLVSHEYEKYTYRPDSDPRDIHTGAKLIRSTSELDRALREDLSGRRVWIIGSDRSYQWEELVDRNLRRAIEDRSLAKMQSEDTTRIFRLGT